jgi:hypothetical protein
MEDSDETVAKKPYAEPSLVHYGSIAKLTQGGAGSHADGGGMMTIMS